MLVRDDAKRRSYRLHVPINGARAIGVLETGIEQKVNLAPIPRFIHLRAKKEDPTMRTL